MDVDVLRAFTPVVRSGRVLRLEVGEGFDVRDYVKWKPTKLQRELDTSSDPVEFVRERLWKDVECTPVLRVFYHLEEYNFVFTYHGMDARVFELPLSDVLSMAKSPPDMVVTLTSTLYPDPYAVESFFPAYRPKYDADSLASVRQYLETADPMHLSLDTGGQAPDVLTDLLKMGLVRKHGDFFIPKSHRKPAVDGSATLWDCYGPLSGSFDVLRRVARGDYERFQAHQREGPVVSQWQEGSPVLRAPVLHVAVRPIYGKDYIEYGSSKLRRLLRAKRFTTLVIHFSTRSELQTYLHFPHIIMGRVSRLQAVAMQVATACGGVVPTTYHTLG